MAGTELLHRLFARHDPDPVTAVARLLRQLERIKLPFDVGAQLRELSFPPQPKLLEGLPSTIYYFVPGSGQGSELSPPATVTSPAFIKRADGIGLNMGCPIRLLRALDALETLSLDDRAEPLASLRDPRNHLSAVEELLWVVGWNVSSVGRGLKLPGMAGNVDWRLVGSGEVVHLEAKFRRSDWARMVDYDTFLKAGDGFLSKATHKFPPQTVPGELHVVGLTVFDEVNENFVNALGTELVASPQIHAVVVRSFLQNTNVFALRKKVALRVAGLLVVSDAARTPFHYPVLFHIEQRDERRKQRPPLSPQPRVELAHVPISQTNLRIVTLPEQGLYRLAIPKRGPDGEPQFQVITKYLFP